MADRYFTLINIILITAFVGLGTNTFYKVITRTMVSENVQAPKERVSRSSRPASVRPKSLASYNTVVRRDLFKVAAKEDPLTKKDDFGDVEDTSLPLTLWGTIASESANAWAIIEDKKERKQALYKVGDVIQNATLIHVLRNEVILNYNGKNESLKVDEKRSPGSGIRPSPRDFAERDEPDEDGGEAKKITVERSMIDESLKDINTLMKDVRIRPHFKDGQPDGLIVSGIRGDSVFKKLGLRNGDIIMGVDGNKIESVDDAMKLYGGLKEMQNMKVEIKRRGQLQTLDFDIK